MVLQTYVTTVKTKTSVGCTKALGRSPSKAAGNRLRFTLCGRTAVFTSCSHPTNHVIVTVGAAGDDWCITHAVMMTKASEFSSLPAVAVLDDEGWIKTGGAYPPDKT